MNATDPSRAEASPGRRSLAALALGAALAVPLVLAVLVAVRDEKARRPELASLQPVARLVVGAGQVLAARPRALVAMAGGIVAVVLALVALVGLARRGKDARAPALALFACALAALGQARLVLGYLAPGVALYAVALALFAAALVLSRKNPETDTPSGARISPWVGAVSLVVIAWTGLFYRFYALGQFPPDFDGEASWFMACATSLYGATQINFGSDGPWSPFGWLYYLPVLFFTKTCGTTLLSIRLVSAVTGFLALPLFFSFLRRLAGTLEAVLGTVLLCFGLTEVFWSRTDIFPYHGPGLVAIALAWASYEAITTERLRYFVAAAALMALSYHQYPSGQTSFLIPLGAVLGRSLLAPGFLRRTWKGVLVLFLGAALWLGGLSINGVLAGRRLEWRNPFVLNPGKTIWSLPLEHPGPGAREKFIAENMVKSIGVIVKTQFVKVVPSSYPHHEGVPPFGELPTRHTSGPAAVLLALGVVVLLLRPARPASIVLLSWLVAGALPGILSDFPASRRIAADFPAFLAVAAVAGGIVLKSAAKLLGEKAGRVFTTVALAAMFAGLGAVSAFLTLGRPTSTVPAIAVADAFRPYLKSGALVIMESDYGEYFSTAVTYILLDDLNEGPRPASWRVTKQDDWPTIAFRPLINPNDWVYKYTLLRRRAASFSKDTRFEVVTFLVQNSPERKTRLEILEQVWAGRTFRHLQIFSPNALRNFTAVTIDGETLRETRSPVVTAPEAGAEIPPADWWDGVEVRVKRDNTPSAPATVSAGFWIPEQRWISLRFRGAGAGAKLLLDEVRLDDEESRPVTRGIHRVDLTLGTSPELPLKLEMATNGRAFEAVRPFDITSPRLAAVPALAGEPVLLYPGFDPPDRVVDAEPQFLSDAAISPEGSVAIVRALRDAWKVEVHPPGGGPPKVWEQPKRAGETANRTTITFIGEKNVAFASWPHLFVFDRQAKLQKEIDLTSVCQDARGLAGNELGEIFVLSPSRYGIVVLSLDGRETGFLQPKDTPKWLPMTLSASYRGPVAVRDSADRIRVFEKGPSGWEAVRVQPGEYAVTEFRYSIRSDGWLFSQDSNTREAVVFDRELKRRVSLDPIQDLSRFELGNKFLGFDRAGRLYTENNGRVTRIAPVNDPKTVGKK